MTPDPAAGASQVLPQSSSPADRDLFNDLFAQRVPEVAGGRVQVVNAVREPGCQTKVAVWSRDSGLNAASVCIGTQGVRVHAVEALLAGERISMVNYDPDPLRYVANAIDFTVISVKITCERLRDVRAVVPVEAFAAAIGRGANNVRLASALTGWRITICTDRCRARHHVHPRFDASTRQSVWGPGAKYPTISAGESLS